jgi:Amidohydrolase family
MNKERLKIVFGCLILIIGPSGCATDTERPESPDIPSQQSKPAIQHTLYRGVSLIDGSGAAVKSNSSLLVAGDTVEAVFLNSGDIPSSLPSNTREVDASHWYVLPGLIDTHVHLATSPDRRAAQGTLRRYLYSGITSVRDMAGDIRALADLSRASLVQEIPAPDVYYSALMAGPSFFSDPRTVQSAQGEIPGTVPWMQAITDKSDMPTSVSLARGTGATGIKIYANLPADLVKNIAAEGRAQGIKVWSHSMVFPALPGEVVAANVDVMSHVCRIAFEAVDEKPKEYNHRVRPDYSKIKANHPAITKIFSEMAARDIILDATLRLYGEKEKTGADKTASAGPAFCPLSFAVALVREALNVGVDVAAGTDGDTPYNEPYPALYEELDILVNQVGLTPLQAIRSATYIGAKTLGKESEIGLIAAGMRANLVFVERNPAEDIANLRSVVLTVKRGVEYPRSAFKKLKSDETVMP